MNSIKIYSRNMNSLKVSPNIDGFKVFLIHKQFQISIWEYEQSISLMLQLFIRNFERSTDKNKFQDSFLRTVTTISQTGISFLLRETHISLRGLQQLGNANISRTRLKWFRLVPKVPSIHHERSIQLNFYFYRGDFLSPYLGVCSG